MGAASQALRSSVPIRSNDSGNPSSSAHDTTRGSICSRHCGATHSAPVPAGVHAHL